MRRPIRLRPIVVLLAICAFAALDAIVKGHHGGTRNAIGNVSAPWALIPFLSAAFVGTRRLAFGALLGAASTTVALATYSCVRAMSGFGPSEQRRGISHLLIGSLGNRWLLLGALGGAVVGAVGAWSAAREHWALVAAVITSLLVLEPCARMIWAIAKGEGARTMIPSPTVWAVEVMCGCAVGLAFWLRRTLRRQRP